MKRILFKNVALFTLVGAVVGCSSSSEQAKTVTEDVEGTPKHFEKFEAKPNSFWWPEKLDLSPLRQHGVESNPLGEKFNYAKEFAKLDIKQVKKDIEKVMKTSQEWWPADWGHYGPFFIRMAWHSSGTYRLLDGRGGAAGGQMRFEPLNSWPDNANLDRARRLLWPIKKKYGNKLSWADLMVLTGNVAMESMGFETIGFAGGRTDDWEADLVYWGPETKMLSNKHRYKKGKGGKRKLQKPLGASQMGLIYVNPEGPNGNHDPLAAAESIREAFGRMAMNDEETLALIAGGHTFGKAHGAHKADDCLKDVPANAPVEKQGFGWNNKCGSGKGKDAVTSGLEGAWTSSPTMWTHQYLENLFKFNWVKTKSPAGATQWIPENGQAANLVPDAHVRRKRHAPIMFTTDLALKEDPAYRKIAKRFLDNPKEFEAAFARAWFKLTHRDMGPSARYVGKEVPKDVFKWQDPVPARNYKLISKAQTNELKNRILKSGLSLQELVKAAWASASTYRATDMRGGANGARIRLEPMVNWEVNNPEELKATLKKLSEIQKNYNRVLPKNVRVSLADVIVVGGSAAIEKAARNGGVKVNVPVALGRTDATLEDTDIESFEVLEPKADAFRNYYSKSNTRSPAEMLVDRSNLLGLNVPEMTALIGGMRTLGATTDNSKDGVFTKNTNALTNDFFVNLLDMSTEWKKSEKSEMHYVGVDRKTGEQRWSATPVDLIFGSHSELRAVAEVYAADNNKKLFVNEFVDAWTKVMQADRFDLN